MEKFTQISQIREYCEKHHNHFFDDKAMKGFNTRIDLNVFGGRYFVTSSKMDEPYQSESRPRLYTVRKLTESGNPIAVGEGFEGYKTLQQARKAAVKLVEEEDKKKLNAFIDWIKGDENAYKYRNVPSRRKQPEGVVMGYALQYAESGACKNLEEVRTRLITQRETERTDLPYDVEYHKELLIQFDQFIGKIEEIQQEN